MEKLLRIKQKIGSLSKSSTNPFFKSKYLDLNDLLNAIEPLLWEENLLLSQPIIDDKVCSQIFECDTGVLIANSELRLPDIRDPQKIGACITYFRRYTLKSLLAISEEDDDGNSNASAETKLIASNSLKELQDTYIKLTKEEQIRTVSLKDELKLKLK